MDPFDGPESCRCCRPPPRQRIAVARCCGRLLLMPRGRTLVMALRVVRLPRPRGQRGPDSLRSADPSSLASAAYPDEHACRLAQRTLRIAPAQEGRRRAGAVAAWMA